MSAKTKPIFDTDLPPGILDRRVIPDEQFDKTWDSIFLGEGVKDQLLNQAIVGFTLRSKGVGREIIPTHGIVLLVGPPGTGKTSLARGLASRVARMIKGATFLEIEPHSLTSSSMGKTQQAVTDLLGKTIPEHAASGPVIVLLDEVETMATDRRKLSMEANPVDVHRATDAVLAQLDHLAERHGNLLFIATSNFEGAIDDAFISRCDLVMTVPVPNAKARRSILEDTIEGLAKHFSSIKKLLATDEFERVVEVTEGLDGRALRKMVAGACAYTKEAAVDPGKLTVEALLKAAEDAKTTLKRKEK
ncbi:MAG: ATP-binding protein [Chloracidobacterium sp.]|nr:ATP-binding protein [Chloracidobacterium sp.]